MPTTKARIAIIISSSGDVTGTTPPPVDTTPPPPPVDTGPGPHIAIYDVDFYDDPDARYGP